MSVAVLRKRRATTVTGGWISLHKAAEATGVSRHGLLIKAFAKEIRGRMSNGQVQISTDSVDRLCKSRESRALDLRVEKADTLNIRKEARSARKAR